MSIWDHKSKKRLRQYPKYHSPVPSIAFNNDGTKLAVGVSYTWEEGEEGAKTAERPAVFIKNVGEEVKVRFFLNLNFVRVWSASEVWVLTGTICVFIAEGLDGVAWGSNLQCCLLCT